jgi:Ca-activated chloride channel family protein
VQVAVRTQVGGEGVTVRGFRGHDPWQTQFAAKGGATHNGLAKLWARRKIDDLTHRGLDGRLDSEAVRLGITELALEHHLVSKHTSLVAVDQTPTRPADETVEPRPVPVELPAGWTASNAQLVMPQGGTASRLALLLGSLALLLAFGLLRGGRP